MGWQGYDNEGCMPGDRERFARIHDRRLEIDCKCRIATAKRDLAEKVLEAIDGERLHENLDNEGDKGYQQAVDDVRAAVERAMQGAGITLTSTQKGNK